MAADWPMRGPLHRTGVRWPALRYRSARRHFPPRLDGDPGRWAGERSLQRWPWVPAVAPARRRGLHPRAGCPAGWPRCCGDRVAAALSSPVFATRPAPAQPRGRSTAVRSRSLGPWVGAVIPTAQARQVRCSAARPPASALSPLPRSPGPCVAPRAPPAARRMMRLCPALPAPPMPPVAPAAPPAPPRAPAPPRTPAPHALSATARTVHPADRPAPAPGGCVCTLRAVAGLCPPPVTHAPGNRAPAPYPSAEASAIRGRAHHTATRPPTVRPILEATRAADQPSPPAPGGAWTARRSPG